MKRRVLQAAVGVGVIGWLWTAAWCPTALAEDPSTPSVLTLAEAVRLGLSHQPSLMAAKGTTQAQLALVGVSRSNLLPQVNFNSSYLLRTNNPSFNSTFNSTDSSSAASPVVINALSLQQLLFDFGKTGAEVESAKENLKGSQLNEENSRQTVVVNVKITYYALLATRHLEQVQEETVRQAKEHLDQTQGFYQAGTRTKFDVTNAEVTLTNAQLDLIRARNAVEVARVTLANAMGVPDQPIGNLEELLAFEKFEISEEQALKEGLANRPDLQSLAAQRLAAEASVRSAQRTHFPVISGVADFNYGNQRSTDLGYHFVHNWDVGANLTLPIFSGFLIQSQVAQANANLVVANANEESLRQDVILAIHAAYSTLVETEERVKTAEVVVRQAQENLDLANGRFQAGVGTSIEQTDAQVTLADAKTSQIQALFDYRVAAAGLEKAMGRPVP
jgi:outer membrane protein